MLWLQSKGLDSLSVGYEEDDDVNGRSFSLVSVRRCAIE